MSLPRYREEKFVAPQQKGAWFSFIKSIATFNGDLSSLSAPPFLLSPQSMTEFSAYWCENPSLFVAPAHEDDPVKRVLAVLRWFLSTLKQQHSNKDENGKKKKLKPLNPFLGEVFLGKWKDESGTTNLVTEQVSHHPPATAFNIWNEEHGIKLQGHVVPKSHFSGTVHIDRKGYSLLHIDKYNEDYLITMPTAHIEGLMIGSLSLELSGSSYIRSSSGYTIKIDYSCKGWLGGKRNLFVANVFRDDNPNDPLYVAEGQWCDTFTIKEVKTQRELEIVDLKNVSRTPLRVAPIEDQHPLESRRAWQYVSAAINQGDIFAVGFEKSKIENEQREMRQQERASGIEFPRRYFCSAVKDLVAEKLVEGVMVDTSMKRQMNTDHGIWRWDEEKYQRIQSSLWYSTKSPSRMRFDSGVGGIIDGSTESDRQRRTVDD